MFLGRNREEQIKSATERSDRDTDIEIGKEKRRETILDREKEREIMTEKRILMADA